MFVVLRDNFLSLIRVKQRQKGYHVHGVELFPPGSLAGGSLFGARVITAREEEEFRQALQEGLAGNAPLVIEAVVDPAEYAGIL